MPSGKSVKKIENCLKRIAETTFDPLDLLPGVTLPEKLIKLVLAGSPPLLPPGAEVLSELAKEMCRLDTKKCKVVVFGGGTGLSNVIGGDSRHPEWHRNPFNGLKAIFPNTQAVVCVTDDGGSTGELLKDLPLIALGDLRHVLLSSVQKQKLYERYGLTDDETRRTVHCLHALFNHRFSARPKSSAAMFKRAGIDLDVLPKAMRLPLAGLVEALFTDDRLKRLMARPHCLGNLLLVSSMYAQTSVSGADESTGITPEAIVNGLQSLANLIGAAPDAVLPCTVTPAQLKIFYTNGVLSTGEYKSGSARRNCPVDRVFVEFVGKPTVLPEVLDRIRKADILLFAPGSLYTSIVPILQVPGIAEAVRKNSRALKILIANLWVQKGETDLVLDNPKRRFYVSDLLTAYHRNIPGGVHDLFNQVLALGLQDISGSILQNYALEEKEPIYLDRNRVRKMGFSPVEAGIFAPKALQERMVIQHDPASLAKAVRAMWAVGSHLNDTGSYDLPPCFDMRETVINNQAAASPYHRLHIIEKRLRGVTAARPLKGAVSDILWRHPDIPIEHLAYVQGVSLIDPDSWARCQEWDNVFSFYDPDDRRIKIRQDMFDDPLRFEIAFLVALGQSLLGNYAGKKEMLPIEKDDGMLGKAYRLTLRPTKERDCFLDAAELDQYLTLARMVRSAENDLVYTRLLNGPEGFTPPGLLFGLTYAWYLDNRFAAHIEYKMAITRMEVSSLIPEQVKMFARRYAMIYFFRKAVFRQNAAAFEEEPLISKVDS